MILGQGAEAIVSVEEGIVTKTRVEKKYRNKTLDKKLRRQRTKKIDVRSQKSGK